MGRKDESLLDLLVECKREVGVGYKTTCKLNYL